MTPIECIEKMLELGYPRPSCYIYISKEGRKCATVSYTGTCGHGGPSGVEHKSWEDAVSAGYLQATHGGEPCSEEVKLWAAAPIKPQFTFQEMAKYVKVFRHGTRCGTILYSDKLFWNVVLFQGFTANADLRQSSSSTWPEVATWVKEHVQ